MVFIKLAASHTSILPHPYSCVLFLCTDYNSFPSVGMESPWPMPLGTTLPSFQLRQLEEDVVSTFISGKPLIDDDPTQFRIVFKFKETRVKEQIFSLGYNYEKDIA